MTWFSYTLLSALLLSAATLIQKKALLKEHAMEFSAVLAVLSALISAPLFFTIDYQRLELPPLVILFFTSILGAAAFFLVSKSIRHMEVSESSPLLVLGPSITIFLAYLFLGEQLTRMQGVGAGLLLLGSYALETKPHHDLLEPIRVFIRSRYIHYILIALALYSVTGLFDRILLARYQFQPEAYIAFAHTFLAFHFFVMISIFHNGTRGIVHGLKTAGVLIFIVAVLTVAYRYAQAEAVRIAYVGLVLSLKRISGFFTTVIGGELFHERNLIRKSIASLIIVGGALLMVL